MTADKEALCVIGAVEQRKRVRGVFGIPHTAAKINNQLFLDSQSIKHGVNYGRRKEILLCSELRGPEQ